MACILRLASCLFHPFYPPSQPQLSAVHSKQPVVLVLPAMHIKSSGVAVAGSRQLGGTAPGGAIRAQTRTLGEAT